LPNRVKNEFVAIAIALDAIREEGGDDSDEEMDDDGSPEAIIALAEKVKFKTENISLSTNNTQFNSMPPPTHYSMTCT
jgi:hypothetical protein